MSSSGSNESEPAGRRRATGPSATAHRVYGGRERVVERLDVPGPQGELAAHGAPGVRADVVAGDARAHRALGEVARRARRLARAQVQRAAPVAREDRVGDLGARHGGGARRLEARAVLLHVQGELGVADGWDRPGSGSPRASAARRRCRTATGSCACCRRRARGPARPRRPTAGRATRRGRCGPRRRSTSSSSRGPRRARRGARRCAGRRPRRRRRPPARRWRCGRPRPRRRWGSGRRGTGSTTRRGRATRRGSTARNARARDPATPAARGPARPATARRHSSRTARPGAGSGVRGGCEPRRSRRARLVRPAALPAALPAVLPVAAGAEGDEQRDAADADQVRGTHGAGCRWGGIERVGAGSGVDAGRGRRRGSSCPGPSSVRIVPNGDGVRATTKRLAYRGSPRPERPRP